MKVRDDHFNYWVYSGIAGVLTRDCWNFFSKMVGFAQFYIWQLGASAVIKKPFLNTFWGNVVGFLVDFTIGSIFGVLFGLIIEWRGPKHFLMKGIGVGLTAWMFFYGLLYHNLPFTTATAPSEPLSIISAFIGHVIFGAATAVVYVMFFLRKEAERNEEKDKKVNDSKVKKRKAREEADSGEILIPPEQQVILVEVNKDHPSLPRHIERGGFVKPRKLLSIKIGKNPIN
ncbi:MAG: hypothetical protein ACYCX4_16650 [Bacillota bacterium]